MEKKKQVSKKERKSIAAELGRQGGRAIARKRGKGYMKELGKRGAKARWQTKEKVKTN